MGIDRSKILHHAQLFASKGQYDAAINEWKKLSAESPGDGSIYNSIGELHLKRNAAADAVAAFLQAANAFRTEGATLKAIATYKKVLKLDPSRYDIYRFLGDLNAERGLLSSAVQDYLTLGKFYLKERKTKEALEIYKKIVSQDPSNLDAQQRVAELCVQENMQDEATKVYLQLGRERSAQQRYSEAKEAYQSVLRIDPHNSEAAQFIEHFERTGGGPAPAAAAGKGLEPMDLLAEARRRIDDKQYAGAEAILNQLLSKEPGNPQVCQLLAKLHLQQGQLQVALGEYRFLAGAALRAQEYAQAEQLIREFLAVEPDSVPLLELHGELYEEQGNIQTAVQHFGRAVEVLLEHPEPGMPSLHEEIFEKIKNLAPESPVVQRLTALMHGETRPSDALQRTTAPSPLGQAPEPCTVPTAAPTEGVAFVHSAADHPSTVPETPCGQDQPLMAVQEHFIRVEPSESAPASLLSANGEQDVDPGSIPQPGTEPLVQTDTSPAVPPDGLDLETHYTLGVAYKNMGLLEEAKEEFLLSMTSPTIFLDSCLMTAVCLKEQGQIEAAIAELERLLNDPRCQGAKTQAIRYELGLLYERQTQWEQAVSMFESIPTFHDVPERLSSIKTQQAPSISPAQMFRYA
ncbi:MAG TPA: tetratricopeptide repeat protein [Nitrospira sp.]|nr:tetratricopeptide repeat protein [Nitrospira sp.]